MRLRLQAKYSLMVVGLIAAMLGAVVALHLSEVRAMFAETSQTYADVIVDSLTDHVRRDGEGRGKFLAQTLSDPMHRLEVDRIREALRAARRQEGILWAAVCDFSGDLVAETPRGTGKRVQKNYAAMLMEARRQAAPVSKIDGDQLVVVAPIMAGREVLGSIELGLSLTEIRAEIAGVQARVQAAAVDNQQRFYIGYAVIAVAAALLGLVASLVMVRGIVQPIQALGDYTRRIGGGHYNDPPPIERHDELGDLARALEQMAKDLKQVAQVARLATLGEMAVGMAHELNQPLNTLRMAAENALMAMEQGKASPEFALAKLTLIVHQAESMGDLIKRMCVVGRNEGPKEVIDPRESVRDAHSLLVGQYEGEGLSVTLDLPEPCARVLGRRNELAQVVINLLSNARDAIVEAALARRGTQQATVGRIDVTVLSLPGEVRIRVKDNGGGVPADVIDRIFDPFFTTKEVTKGTGLGLSISYGIVNAMGGRITVENFGGGALFTVVLPVIEDPRPLEKASTDTMRAD